jgi:putative ATPase
VLAGARDRLETAGIRTVLFVDEIHRFNRSQQDVLLGDVEEGVVVMLGATTENPFFSVNTPLLSRSQVFRFEPLDAADIRQLLLRALGDERRGLGSLHATATDEAIAHIAEKCDGDARKALAALEVAVLSQSGDVIEVDLDVAAESIQQKVIRYDAKGDEHYDVASALIKSIRGSDPDAAIYWLARALEAGEDPRFLARRIVIAAAEDIGNADPMALVLAQSAADATAFIGLPECQLPLAQAVIFLACAEKSNSATTAIGAARRDVRESRTIVVPKHLRSGVGQDSASPATGSTYRNPHSEESGMVDQDYLGVDRTYYHPTGRGREERMAAYLDKFKALRASAQRPPVSRA